MAVVSNPIVDVVAGVIRRADGKMLLALRHKDAHQGGLWEFPGGKREPNENRFAALKRELREELGITICSATPLLRLQYAYPTKTVDLDAWEVLQWDGTERGCEGQQIAWVAPSELTNYRFPAANEPIIRAAFLPRILLTLALSATLERFPVEQFKSAIAAGLGNILHFPAGFPASLRDFRMRELIRFCGQVGTKLLIIDDALSERGFNSKAHALSSNGLGDYSRNIFVGVVCNAPEELAHAELNGADFAVLRAQIFENLRAGLSPVAWTELAALVLRSSMPVYIEGDFGEPDLARAINAGCQGIALNRSFRPTDSAMITQAAKIAEVRDSTNQTATYQDAR
ncbi:MAG: NUDIX domain-containing protein [Proteobacteria bacterium]|nr:NUDIX domain-containing protein [Pseudomonadota bacterium]